MQDASFLPEDYLAQKAERRTNVLSLTLFVVVMGGVFGAFLVTNTQWSQVKDAQASINTQYQEAAIRIEELNQLEEQRTRMLNKAELASALVERVPRSILLAELINRMPPRLSLTEFTLRSSVQRSAPPARTDATRRLQSAGGNNRDRAQTREEATQERTVEVPKYLVELTLVGVAPTDLEVSRYITELNGYPLVRDVTLKHSVYTTVNEQDFREFRIEMRLNPDADVRAVDPLVVPRGLRNPMTDELRFISPTGQSASVDPRR